MIDTKTIAPGDWIQHEGGAICQVSQVQQEDAATYASVVVKVFRRTLRGPGGCETGIDRILQRDFDEWKKVSIDIRKPS